MDRRKVLQQLGAGLASVSLGTLGFSGQIQTAADLPLPTKALIKDEEYWRKFGAAHYKVSPDFINLENGYFGVQPLAVIQKNRANLDRVNQNSSKFMRQEFYQKEMPDIMNSLAAFSGASPSELLLTRNATEALNILIQGYPWQKGDEVILQHHDYHSMIETYQMLQERKGIKLVFAEVPLVDASQEDITQIYLSLVTPATRCIHLTHLTHLTGQIMPVAQIASSVKSKNIDVIVDAAHSFAQLDFKIKDLEADFVGVNLHKWFGNPLGAGLMYVNESRIPELAALYGDAKKSAENIQRLGHFGTPAPAIWMCIPEAANFNNLVGMPVKEERLRYLQNYWTHKAASLDRVAITTPVKQSQSCALASFSIDGMDAYEIVRKLDEDFGVFTVIRKLKDRVVVRVTPNLYNNTDDLDKLLEGIDTLSRS